MSPSCSSCARPNSLFPSTYGPESSNYGSIPQKYSSNGSEYNFKTSNSKIPTYDCRPTYQTSQSKEKFPYFDEIKHPPYLLEILEKLVPESFDIKIGTDSNEYGSQNSRVFGFMIPPTNGNRGMIYVDGTDENAERTAGHELSHIEQLLFGKLCYDISTVEAEADKNPFRHFQ